MSVAEFVRQLREEGQYVDQLEADAVVGLEAGDTGELDDGGQGQEHGGMPVMMLMQYRWRAVSSV